MGRNVYRQPWLLQPGGKGKAGRECWHLREVGLTRALLLIFTTTRTEGVSHI